MSLLILLRHGQSVYNQKNIFTGVLDVGLSTEGIKEAEKARDLLAIYNIDKVFSSNLTRAIDTAMIVAPHKEIIKSINLNERNYGQLQGLNKDVARSQYGEKQIEIWRRSYLGTPPGGESLKDTVDRVMPYFLNEIEPLLVLGQNILICAHGNSLRGLLKYIENINEQDIVKIEVPTGMPIIYEFKSEITGDKKWKRYNRVLTIHQQ